MDDRKGGERAIYPRKSAYGHIQKQRHAQLDNRSRCSHGKTRPSRVSAFFDDTTDEESGPQERTISRSAMKRERKIKDTPVQKFHVGDIQFPATRSVLWDRRVLGGRISVSMGTSLPTFTIPTEILQQLHVLVRRHRDRYQEDEPQVVSYLQASDSNTDQVCLNTLITTNDEPGHGWVLPVYLSQRTEDQQLTQTIYQSMITRVQEISTEDSNEPHLHSLPISLIVSNGAHEPELQCQLEAVLPSVQLSLSLIRNLPLLMTPLATSLSRQEFGESASSRRYGYVTLDSARKAVPLLKTDPLVLDQPLVGLWVYGIHLSDTRDETTAERELSDPYLLLACHRFLRSGLAKERVAPSKNTFLIVLYPSAYSVRECGASPFPRFLECAYPDDMHPSLYTRRQSLPVGTSTFNGQVELSLVRSTNAEWELARQGLRLPEEEVSEIVRDSVQSIPTRRYKRHVSDGMVTTEHNSMSSTEEQNTTLNDHVGDTKHSAVSSIASSEEKENDPSVANENVEKESREAARYEYTYGQVSRGTELGKGAIAATQTEVGQQEDTVQYPHRTAEPTEPNGPKNHDTNYGYCASQQLLTVQHQQILENQQRQLQEMQQQIAELKELLAAARSETRSQPSQTQDADEQVETEEKQLEQSTTDNISLGNVLSVHDAQDEQMEDTDSVAALLDNVLVGDQTDEPPASGEYNKESSLSSLELSSLSKRSNMSDLSSLSETHSRSDGQERLTLFSEEELDVSSAFDASADDQASITTAENDRAEQEDEEQRHDQDTLQDNVIAERHEAETKSDTEATNVEERCPLEVEEKERTSRVDTLTIPRSNVDEYASSDDVEDQLRQLDIPESYLRKAGAVVTYVRSTYTSLPADMQSFSIPRIKFSVDSVYPSDSEDEDLRRIERKYAPSIRS